MYASNLLAAAAVISVSLAACAPGASLNDSPIDRPGSTADSQTQVRVTNDNWQEIRVFAERNGVRVRLGNVATMATAVFRLPATLTGTGASIRLIADPVGSGERHITHSVTPWPGQLIEYTVRNELSISSLMVRSR
jgi:hypothetical protein